MARILLVEDAADLRNALVLALRSAGHVVAAADDGDAWDCHATWIQRVQVRAGGGS
jgi:CheY-like chemotaxis protein